MEKREKVTKNKGHIRRPICLVFSWDEEGMGADDDRDQYYKDNKGEETRKEKRKEDKEQEEDTVMR